MFKEQKRIINVVSLITLHIYHDLSSSDNSLQKFIFLTIWLKKLRNLSDKTCKIPLLLFFFLEIKNSIMFAIYAFPPE